MKTRVIITRPSRQAEPLIAALRARDFEPIPCPLIQIDPIDDGPIDVGDYDWIIVTSANGAAELAQRRSGDLPRVAAIGESTAAALREHGIKADFVPSVTSQEGLVAELPRPVGRALFVGAEGARRYLADHLPADFRPVYRTLEVTVNEPPDGDIVLLASPSAARAWAKLGSAAAAVITIGPQTSAAARRAGLRVAAEARTQDVEGLVDSAAAWRASSRS